MCRDCNGSFILLGFNFCKFKALWIIHISFVHNSYPNNQMSNIMGVSSYLTVKCRMFQKMIWTNSLGINIITFVWTFQSRHVSYGLSQIQTTSCHWTLIFKENQYEVLHFLYKSNIKHVIYGNSWRKTRSSAPLYFAFFLRIEAPVWRFFRLWKHMEACGCCWIRY